MTDTFKPGDMAYVCSPGDIYHMRACTILSSLKPRHDIITGKIIECYHVDLPAPLGYGTAYPSKELRKIPPHNHPTQWDESIFKPDLYSLNEQFEAIKQRVSSAR